jgi:Flp pilus assembly protein TadG
VGEARAFGGDRRGAVSVIFCVAATVLFGLVGGAINYARLLARRNQLQAAVYAGALAGGNTRKRP